MPARRWRRRSPIGTRRCPMCASLRPDVPEHVAAALRRAMAKDPADRFASADDMRAAFAAPGLPHPLPPTQLMAAAPRRSSSPSWWWLALGAAALVAVVVFAFGRRDEPSAEPADTTVAPRRRPRRRRRRRPPRRPRRPRRPSPRRRRSRRCLPRRPSSRSSPSLDTDPEQFGTHAEELRPRSATDPRPRGRPARARHRAAPRPPRGMDRRREPAGRAAVLVGGALDAMATGDEEGEDD